MRLPLKYNYSSGKMKWKMPVALLKCCLMVKTERNQEKVIVSKTAFMVKQIEK